VCLLAVHDLRSSRWPLFIMRVANAEVSRIAHIAKRFLFTQPRRWGVLGNRPNSLPALRFAPYTPPKR
jgi:hypothetical protein